jgi:hypothetical protein
MRTSARVSRLGAWKVTKLPRARSARVLAARAASPRLSPMSAARKAGARSPGRDRSSGDSIGTVSKPLASALRDILLRARFFRHLEVP